MSVGKVSRRTSSTAGKLFHHPSGKVMRSDNASHPACCCCKWCEVRPPTIDMSWSGITIYSSSCCQAVGQHGQKGSGGAWTAGPYELSLAYDGRFEPPFTAIPDNSPCLWHHQFAVASPLITFYTAGTSCGTSFATSSTATLEVFREDGNWDADIHLHETTTGFANFAVVASILNMATDDCSTGGTQSVLGSTCQATGTRLLYGGTGTITLEPNMAP